MISCIKAEYCSQVKDVAPGGRSAGPLPGRNAPGGRSAGPLPGPAVCREMKWPWLLCSEKGLRRAFIICSFASLGERLLLQEAGRSLSQNFVCAHVRLGRCYCRRPDGALTGGLKRRQLRPHWKHATQDISMSSRWSRLRLRASELGCSCLDRCVPQSQRASTLLACAICNGLTAAPSCRNACVPRKACAQCARHRLRRSTTCVHSGRQAMGGRHGH